MSKVRTTSTRSEPIAFQLIDAALSQSDLLSGGVSRVHLVTLAGTVCKHSRTGYYMTSAISQHRCAAAAHLDAAKCSNTNADGSQQKEAAGHRLKSTLCRVEMDWRQVRRGPSRDSHMCECHISVKCPICIRNTSHSS